MPFFWASSVARVDESVMALIKRDKRIVFNDFRGMTDQFYQRRLEKNRRSSGLGRWCQLINSRPVPNGQPQTRSRCLHHRADLQGTEIAFSLRVQRCFVHVIAVVMIVR